MIRKITKSEIPDCVEVICKSFLTVADEFGFTVENAPRITAFATTRERLTWQWEKEQRLMFAYFEDGKMAGYYSLLRQNEKECELNNLCVLEEYRQRKIGEQLLQHAFNEAGKMGCLWVNIGIVEENVRLRKWYEKHGAVHIGTEKYDFFPFTCGYMRRAVEGSGEGEGNEREEETVSKVNYFGDRVLGKMAGFLIKNANPSIVFHVKNDILKNITEEEKRELHDRVMREEIIQRIIACQKENGWLGNGFHGSNKNAGRYENQEVGVKYLGEKLIFRDTPVLKNAIEAFKTAKPDLFGDGDTDCDRYAAAGSDIIMASCVARAGYEDLFDISKEITASLDSFRRVTEVNSVTDVVKIRKRRPERVNPEGIAYVFNEYEKWPCRYHLDILAHTKSWRSKENISMLAHSFQKLLRDNGLDYFPAYCVDIGHLVGCCGAFREGMKMGVDRDGTHYVSLDLVEYMCRCGLYELVPQLKKEVDTIYDSVDEHGICRVSYDERALKGMGTYSGGQLEVDWRSRTRKLCDVTYRGLVILFYSGLRM